jgi:hypothetical protein
MLSVNVNVNDDDKDIINNLKEENMMLKGQLDFLVECIRNQMTNLETLCETSKNNLIHKAFLKPYYEKIYKCQLRL